MLAGATGPDAHRGVAQVGHAERVNGPCRTRSTLIKSRKVLHLRSSCRTFRLLIFSACVDDRWRPGSDGYVLRLQRHGSTCGQREQSQRFVGMLWPWDDHPSYRRSF